MKSSSCLCENSNISLQWLTVWGITETETQSLLSAKPSAFLRLYRHFLLPHSDNPPNKALSHICSHSILITDIPGGQYWPWFDLIPPKGYSIYPRRQKQMSSQRSISLEARTRIFQFDQVFLIPPALESICLINSGLQSLTSGSELMSAFVWVWRQTKGKANPTIIIIIGAWNQIEEASERGRDRQRKWRKRTMGILAIIYRSGNNNIQIKDEMNAAIADWLEIMAHFLFTLNHAWRTRRQTQWSHSSGGLNQHGGTRERDWKDLAAVLGWGKNNCSVFKEQPKSWFSQESNVYRRSGLTSLHGSQDLLLDVKFDCCECCSLAFTASAAR